MFIDSAGVRLHTVDWGGEGRTILLFPGLGDTARIYDGLAARLSASYRVLGLTRRGHGRSQRPVCFKYLFGAGSQEARPRWLAIPT